MKNLVEYATKILQLLREILVILAIVHRWWIGGPMGG